MNFEKIDLFLPSRVGSSWFGRCGKGLWRER